MRGTNQLLTIWNRYRGENNEDVFQRFTIPVLCKYKVETIKTASGQGSMTTTLISNVQIVIIPFTEFYKEPKNWILAKEEYFTLQINDLIALGEHYIDITGITPYRESEIRQSLSPNIFSIKAITDNTKNGLGKHWRIEGV